MPPVRACWGEGRCASSGACGPATERGLSAVDCCTDAFHGGWPVSCMDDGDPDDGPANCCRPAGSACNGDGRRCWSAACANGRCGA